MTDRKLTDLSFACERDKGKAGWLWRVEPTGHHGDDCAIGCRLAVEWLRYNRGTVGDASDLGAIVRSMIVSPNAEAERSIVIGFMSVIGRIIASGIAKGIVDPDVVEAVIEGEERQIAAFFEDMRQERSDRARRAANARWDRQRARRGENVVRVDFGGRP
jgi:hypothetical protein